MFYYGMKCSMKKNANSVRIGISASFTEELRKGINGYIHFEVSWSDYSYIPEYYAQGIRKDVRTHELIVLEKGKARDLVINDNTDITIYGKKYTVKQLEKLHILTVTNNSSVVIKDLMYRDYEINDLYERNLEKGKRCHLESYRFYDKYDSAPDLKFTLITKTGKELKATLSSSNLKISDGRHKDFSITDYTEVSVSFVGVNKTEPLEYFFNEKYEG